MADVTIVLRPTKRLKKKIMKSTLLKEIFKNNSMSILSPRGRRKLRFKERDAKKDNQKEQVLVGASQIDEEEDSTEHTVPDRLTWWQQNALSTGKDNCKVYTVQHDGRYQTPRNPLTEDQQIPSRPQKNAHLACYNLPNNLLTYEREVSGSKATAVYQEDKSKISQSFNTNSEETSSNCHFLSELPL
jgi:hypothetical protein